ncbi:MAG TPA: AAA family ATPase, partial [Ignavibacteriaceae bacterium]|nr:AAA family ATPase [Ignavibacteriaceae bacterium]
MIKRLIEAEIREKLFIGKSIILYGARQVGKTTLVKSILDEFGSEGRYLNCEILSVEQNLEDAEPEKLKAYLGNYKLVVLDEAQNVRNIGKILKLITDSLPEIQIVATGSSSFDLANKTAEPMTGRAYSYILYPLSSVEVSNNSDWFTFEAKLDGLLRFGAYPEIFLSDEISAVEKLSNLSSGYLYKDLLKFDGIKKSSLLNKLLISLALQSGNEVSYNELATK